MGIVEPTVELEMLLTIGVFLFFFLTDVTHLAMNS